MNPLKKGPQIKLPDKLPQLKVPKFLSDLYADLRDRRLLPLVAVLAVAIIVVPIALSESGGTEEETGAGRTAAPLAESSGIPSGARNVVVTSSTTEGLRSYRRRLRHLSAADPFKQKYVNPPAGEEKTTGETGSGGSSGGSGGTEGTSPSGGGFTGNSEGGGESAAETPQLKYFTYKIDVRIVPVSANGVPSSGEPYVRRGLPELTMLPGHETPALVFMQPSADGKKALMLVTSNVKSIFGEGVCAAGGESCQLLALQPGLPETIVYGNNERVFRIELLKIELVTTDHLTKAPLGTPKSGS